MNEQIVVDLSLGRRLVLIDSMVWLHETSINLRFIICLDLWKIECITEANLFQGKFCVILTIFTDYFRLEITNS